MQYLPPISTIGYGFSIRRAITIMCQRGKLPIVRNLIENQTDRAKECGVQCLDAPDFQPKLNF